MKMKEIYIRQKITNTSIFPVQCYISVKANVEQNFLYLFNLLQVSLVQIFMADDAPKYYNAEVLLPDYRENYRKWSGNFGFVNQAHYSPLLAAFSHWTFVVTDNYLLVVDLQGVDRENKYILTDPSIHCEDPKFGNTNLGIVGIEQFFKTHKCNDICAAMRLPKNKHMKSQFKTRIGKYLFKSCG